MRGMLIIWCGDRSEGGGNVVGATGSTVVGVGREGVS